MLDRGADGLAVGPGGVVHVLLEERPSALDVATGRAGVGIGRLLGEPGAVGAEEAGAGRHETVVAQHLRDLGAIGAHGEGPTDAHVVGGRDGGVEDGAARQVADIGDGAVVAVAVVDEREHLLGRAAPKGLDDLDVVGLEADGAGLLVGDRPEIDRVEVGELLPSGVGEPVVRVADDREVTVTDPLVEHEGAGADGVRCELVGAHLLVCLARHRHADDAAEQVGEAGVGGAEDVLDGHVVDDLHAGDAGVEEGAAGVARFGVEQAAVVELDAVTQRDGPLGEVLVRLVGLG